MPMMTLMLLPTVKWWRLIAELALIYTDKHPRDTEKGFHFGADAARMHVNRCAVYRNRDD